jgi:acetyl-CoA carboxylase, carboxyl transferase, alpha subunit
MENNRNIDNSYAYDTVTRARSKERPKAQEFAEALIKKQVFLHGDRYFGEDPCVFGGIGLYHRIPVTFLGMRKSKEISENIKYNFGMPNPEGYRKAIRLMKQAEKFSRPVITFIDTPGAYPGIGAEERGQGQAIASCIACMASLTVPSIAIFTGEGGSGGALAFATANKVIMMENSIYSVLSPEGFATILWKDANRAKEAANIMKLTAKQMYEYKVADDIVKEDEWSDEDAKKRNFLRLDKIVQYHLLKLMDLSEDDILKLRKEKYFKMGEINGIRN